MSEPSRLSRLLGFIEIDPANLLLRRDAIHEACGACDWEAARKLLDEGLRIHPGEGDLRVLRARCLYHLQRPQDAIADLEAHLGVSPDDAEAHGLLALLSYEQGGTDAACEHVDAALQRDPEQVEALLTRAYVSSDALKLHVARVSFDTAVRVDPRCGRGWLGLALLDLCESRAVEAKRNVQAAASYMPQHIGTWHVLAWANITLGDVAGAQAAFDEALVLDRNFGETHGGLAVIAALQGRDEEARVSVRRALRLDPQALSPKYAEILLLQREGRHEDASVVF
jgi:tetratricopeptide (TPR) repeat protein